MIKYELSDNHQIEFETPDDNYSYFFGYYDKSPLDKDNTMLLTHRVSFDGRNVQDNDVAEIGYFNIKTKNFVKIDETTAWNWQQGSQLQWLPSQQDKIVYNKIINNKFVSVIFDITKKTSKVINFPIYAIHPNGEEALAINYERHYWCRDGYNYQNIKNKEWDRHYHEHDGIYKIDLVTGEINTIIKINDIVNFQRLSDFERSNNWLEHIMYNPKGDRFLFFHRWNHDKRLKSRVYTACSKNGNKLFMFPDKKFYSHTSWKDNESVSIWSLDFTNKINYLGYKSEKRNSIFNFFFKSTFKIMKSIIPESLKSKLRPKAKLFIYKDCSHEYNTIELEAKFVNGHQSWFYDKTRILCDSYQDDKKYRHLMIYNQSNKCHKIIGKFYSAYNDSSYRCDLHPRLSHDNSRIIIDSAHDRLRKIMVIKLTEKNY